MIHLYKTRKNIDLKTQKDTRVKSIFQRVTWKMTFFRSRALACIRKEVVRIRSMAIAERQTDGRTDRKCMQTKNKRENKAKMKNSSPVLSFSGKVKKGGKK